MNTNIENEERAANYSSIRKNNESLTVRKILRIRLSYHSIEMQKSP